MARLGELFYTDSAHVLLAQFKKKKQCLLKKIIIKKGTHEIWKRKKGQKSKTTIWTREPNVTTINAHELNKINMPNKEKLDVFEFWMYTEHRAQPVFIIDPGSKIVSWEMLLCFLSLFFIQNIQHRSFFASCYIYFIYICLDEVKRSEANFSTVFFFLFLFCLGFSPHFVVIAFYILILRVFVRCLSAIFVCCCRHFADLIEILSQTWHRRYQLEIIDNNFIIIYDRFIRIMHHE